MVPVHRFCNSMSQASFPSDSRSATAISKPRAVGDHNEVDTLFSLLEDDDCRRILGTTDGITRSTNEFSGAYDLPFSTTYRGSDPLIDAGLLLKRLRILRSGAHAAGYECTVDGVTVSIAPSGVGVHVSYHNVMQLVSVTT